MRNRGKFWVGRSTISKPELGGRGWNQFHILRSACMSSLRLLLGIEPFKKFVVGGGGGWLRVILMLSLSLKLINITEIGTIGLINFEFISN